MAYNTRLNSKDANFQTMMQNGFGIVTVMNAHVYDIASLEDFSFATKTAYDIASDYGKDAPELAKAAAPAAYRCTLDTLKVANVTMEGPSKTVTGGRYSNPLIKFGKSARLEMQDALGSSEALESLCGGIQESNGGIAFDAEKVVGLHFGEDFASPKMIIGDSFFIDRKTGKQIKVKIIFYQFLPDSIFNLTQDAEGDATVFDMNGDLLTTEILLDDNEPHGVFYSIVDPKAQEIAESVVLDTAAEKIKEGTLGVTSSDGGVVEYSSNGGYDFVSATVANASATKIKAGTEVVAHSVKKGKVTATAKFVVADAA